MFYHEEYPTLKDGLKRELMRNGDVYNFGPALKVELQDYATELGLKFKKSKTSKEELVAMIVAASDLVELAHRYNIGIAGRHWIDKFNISHAELRKLAAKGFLQRTGQIIVAGREGKYTANLYSIVQFYELSAEQINKWLGK